MYRICFRCLNMQVFRIKLGLVTCRAESRHLRLGLVPFPGKHRNVLSGTCSFRLCSKIAEDINKDKREFSTFDEIVSLRREQAKKSVLIEASSKSNFEKIYRICGKFGPIKATFNYSQASGKEILLLECATLEMQQELLKYCHYPNETAGLLVHSRLLYLSSDVTRFESTNPVMPERHAEQEIIPCNSMAEQMERMHMNERLQDLGTRLRFLICQLVEDSLVGLFPHAEVLPFGSTVNGFGRNNCDLDMTLHFNTSTSEERERCGDSKLCFFTRRQLSSERKQGQDNLQVIGDVIRTFFPGVENVNKILRARIPIIEFYHNITGIECDLSLTNKCAFYMAELLHLYGELDSRVRPLVFTVRLWAKRIGLIQSAPGLGISNFMLTLMVVFFLQNRPVPILPSIESLVQLADADDRKYAEGIDCTFQRKAWKIPVTGNTENAGDLLAQFFLFYEKFDFRKKGLSLFTGKDIIKPDGSTMYIQNPLERDLNASCNVGVQEVDRLREAARLSIWKMESDTSADKSNQWEFLKFLETQPIHQVKDLHKGAFTVHQLFKESEANPVHYVVTALSKRKKLSPTVPVGSKVSATLVRKKEHNPVSAQHAATGEIEKSTAKSKNINNNQIGNFFNKGTKSSKRNRQKQYVLFKDW